MIYNEIPRLCMALHPLDSCHYVAFALKCQVLVLDAQNTELLLLH